MRQLRGWGLDRVLGGCGIQEQREEALDANTYARLRALQRMEFEKLFAAD
jgi:hypothetical protein